MAETSETQQQRLDGFRAKVKKMSSQELSSLVAMLKRRSDELREEFDHVAAQMAVADAERIKRIHPK